MNTLETIQNLIAKGESHVDLLALAECDDAEMITPAQLDGEFWVFVKTSLTIDMFPEGKTFLSTQGTNVQFMLKTAELNAEWQ